MAKAEKKLDWKEYPDPTPVEIAMELKRPETMDEKIRRIVATRISEQAAEQGSESFDEANDFDIKDDFEVDEPASPHEIFDMEPEYPEDLVEEIKTPLTESESADVAPSATSDESQPPEEEKK